MTGRRESPCGNMRTSGTNANGRVRPRCVGLHALVLSGRSNRHFGRVTASVLSVRPCTFLMALGNHECRRCQCTAAAGHTRTFRAVFRAAGCLSLSYCASAVPERICGAFPSGLPASPDCLRFELPRLARQLALPLTTALFRLPSMRRTEGVAEIPAPNRTPARAHQNSHRYTMESKRAVLRRYRG